ncbi:thiopeptide-type bacteriocin biosynthesis protein [Streptomyces bobili]
MSWVYDRIYVGAVAGGMEHLIHRLAPWMRQQPDVSRWFFLRYADEGGPHLRLRMKAAGAPEELRAKIDPIIAEVLAELPGVPPPLYRPALAGAPGGRLTLSVIRSVPSQYLPEVGKYGTHGIEVAEELFQHSSEAAADVMADERDGTYSRKTVVPCLMQCVTDAFVPTLGPHFWQRYSAFWLEAPQVPAADLRSRFAAKAAELREQGIPVVADDAGLPERAASVVRTWRRHVTRAAENYRTVTDNPRPSDIALASNFTHLTNNRLGIGLLEEAYYASLMFEDATAQEVT